MTKFKISMKINQPPNIVAQAFLEPENAVQWTTDLEKFEVVKGKPGEIGSVAHLHYIQRGRSYVMEDVLEYAEPGSKYVSLVSGEGMIAHIETIINPSTQGSDITVSWSGTSDRFYIRLLLPFLKRMIIRRAKADLVIFKNLVETHGVNFPRKSLSPESGI